jgi:hypothetical protein
MQENGNIAIRGSSEDDLFRTLARPSFDRIREMHQEFRKNWRETHNGDYPSTMNIAFMKHHGWTWLEFTNEQHNQGLGARA